MKQYRYFNSCVNWAENDVDALIEMINDFSINVARKTFLAHVDRDALERLEEGLGYSAHPRQGLTMAGDYCVSYHRSKLHGKRVYYFTQSAIEYVFT